MRQMEGAHSKMAELYLEVAGGGKYGLDSTHAVVVMVLRWQLLRAQTVGCDYLDCERAGVDETARVQADLGNEGVVRNHHGDGSE